MELKIEIMNQVIDIYVEYRNRRTLSIRIKPTGRVEVLAPKGLSEEVLKELIKSKSKWIASKLEDLKEIDYKPYERKFEDDETFLFLGERYPLKLEIIKGIKRPKISILKGKIHILTSEKDPEFLKKVIEKWYREECLKKIIERVQYFKSMVGEEPRLIRVKEQKKRWGSCTSRRDILFNWRCIMAPIDIIDYIVVHEMCHLTYMNHSKDFWKLVESILPDYKERRAWLKKYGITLTL